MSDKEQQKEQLEREETISDLDLPEGEAGAVKGGHEGIKSEFTFTKKYDKASPNL
jgi:type VI protein secretion system component Hcp